MSDAASTAVQAATPAFARQGEEVAEDHAVVERGRRKRDREQPEMGSVALP